MEKNQSINWYENLAETGTAEAKVAALDTLGIMHEFGLHVEQDLTKAKKYYEQSKALGSEYAEKRLTEIDSMQAQVILK